MRYNFKKNANKWGGEKKDWYWRQRQSANDSKDYQILLSQGLPFWDSWTKLKTVSTFQGI